MHLLTKLIIKIYYVPYNINIICLYTIYYNVDISLVSALQLEKNSITSDFLYLDRLFLLFILQILKTIVNELTLITEKRTFSYKTHNVN